MNTRKKVYVGPSSIHGKGLFARATLPEGACLGTFKGIATRQDGTYVLWSTDEDGNMRGRRGTTELRFLNHSDTPNACFDGYDLYTIEPVRPGEEITIDYEGA